MTKPHKTREEPKIRIEDLEEEENQNKKKWPREEDFKESSDLEQHEEEKLLEHPSHKELEEKLTEMEKKADQYYSQTLRLQAEMENVRRRAERDVANAHKYSLDKILSELLPVIDNLERAAILGDALDNDYARKIREGIELTMSLFLKTLERFGLRQVSPLGEAFNPDFHEAVATGPTGDFKPNFVIEVLQKGYTLNGRLIRPALVVVAKE